MIAVIAIFYISLALIAAMLWMKRTELVTGKKTVLSSAGERTDHVLQGFHKDAAEIVSYFNKHTFIAFIQWTAAHVLSWLRDVYIKLFRIARKYPHSKKVIDMVRGKGDENIPGGASFFLKKISDSSEVGSTTPPTE